MNGGGDMGATEAAERAENNAHCVDQPASPPAAIRRSGRLRWLLKEERKVFFFEKKKQKTFDYVEPGGAQGEGSGIGTSHFLSGADRLNTILWSLISKKNT